MAVHRRLLHAAQYRLGQRDRLTVSERVDAGARSYPSDVIGERCGREVDEIGALRQPDGPPGAPMHRNSVFRLGPVDRICRLLGVEVTLMMARNNGWPPASDRHQRDVDLRHFVRLEVRTGVPRIPPSAGSFNKEAECRSAMRASEMSTTVVVSGQHTYPQGPNLEDFARRHLPKPRPTDGDGLEQAA
jgi:hypothetical protein